MTSKDIDLIKEMLKMQAKLDEEIMKEYGLTELNEEKLRLAILDEVGELTHELKGDWCWWKKTQPKVYKEKVLEELVDVWHFVLSWQNHFNNGEDINTTAFCEDCKFYLTKMELGCCSLAFTLGEMISAWPYKLSMLVAISEYLGFTIEQVYEAYCEKNKVNYQRLESGY